VVLTAFPKRPKMQIPYVRAVPSPRTPFGGDLFEHAQRQRRSLTFAQRARRGRCDNAVGPSRAPWVRCKDVVLILYLEAAFALLFFITIQDIMKCIILNIFINNRM